MSNHEEREKLVCGLGPDPSNFFVAERKETFDACMSSIFRGVES